MATKSKQTETPVGQATAPSEGNGARGAAAQSAARSIQIPRVLTVKELGELMGLPAVEVIKELMKNGVMASINQSIDFETAAIVAHDLGFEPEEAGADVVEEVAETAQARTVIEEEEGAALQPKPPVVTVLGHVDHGKTSLLDVIRRTNVTAGEAGGITQHIGAYQVHTNDQRITFLDTPGHEAFTAMRARGARVTDAAVLVIAADDGIMPQTLEAIDHARAANVPIVVAISKVDLADAKPDRVKQQLAEQGLTIEEYGGDVICVPVSAKTGQGIQELLENILVATEVLELQANPNRPAIGTVIEAQLDRSRGPTATVLVQTGTLQVGDVAVVSETWGRVKAMFNEDGRRIKTAGPGEPAAVLGLQAVPQAGDLLKVVPDDKTARQIIVQRLREKEAATLHTQPRVTLDTLFGQISAGKMKDLNLILKTDVQGSIEPIRQSLERLSTDQVRVKIIHAASGSVSESDVMLAIASKGIIIGFNTREEPGAQRLIEQEGVDLRQYTVIYEVTEDVQQALQGLREPTYAEVVTGHAEVRQVFQLKRRGQVAGCYVRDGTITRNDLVRVLRDGQPLADTKLASLRRFQEDVRDVQAGFECGITVEGFDAFQEGDILELYRRELES
ncbi:MAG: translation initiation factor IF-2 [Chloroflexi bacterium RBG_16_68_14]|nr:MAG: translation initiation factor IF-2 [Chloroflexi bacterium RBG_16_68_14]